MDLDGAQANWKLGRLPFDELPELAAQMMVQGYEGPAILQLVSFHRPGRWDIPEGLVERAFAEAGRTPISLVEATARVAEPLFRKIVDGTASAIEGARELSQMTPWGEAFDGTLEFFYQLDELVDLWGFYVLDRRKYELKIVDVARQFLEKRAQRSFPPT